MKVYLVGGAVRDSLLEIPFKERDYVVVGSSPEELSSKGYMPVGSQFPVFLHPETKEEYALARTERKSGKGHKGFVFHTDTSVTLEEDLVRRDITINAIAQDSDGSLIDPYGGQKDIQNKLIKKVSEAFEEDPLRVYRVCRFAAKLKYLDFKVEKNTLASMNDITLSGELETLPKERIWMETAKALECKNPEVYFELLKECGALEKLIGKIDLDRTFEEREAISGKVVSVLDNAAMKWGVRILRFEIKNLVPPESVRQSMEKQVTAERNRRAILEKSAGQKQSLINTSEGQMRELINNSEGEMQKRINEASGKASEILALGEATAESIKKVANAINGPGGKAAVNLELGQKYIKSLTKLKTNRNKVIMGGNLGDMKEMLKGLDIDF